MDELHVPTRQRIVSRGGLYGLLSGATIAALSVTELATSEGTPAAAVVYAPFAAIVGAVIGAFLGALIASVVAAVAEPSARGDVVPGIAALIAAVLSGLAVIVAAMAIGGAGWPPGHPSLWWLGVAVAATVAGAVNGPALVAPDRRPAAVAARRVQLNAEAPLPERAPR